MRRYFALMVLGATSVSVGPAHAQHHVRPAAGDRSTDSAVARFVRDVRVATSRYRDQGVAVADGYRRIGPDLPSLGEHWVHFGVVVANDLAADRPAMLIYVRGPHGPRLAGVAFTAVLAPGAPYPAFPYAAGTWHEHNGAVDDEALPLTHGHHAARDIVTRGSRLAILHLWIWEPNPAGMWTPDNWALPFVREGLAVPSVSDGAARALALLPDRGRYYLDAVRAAGRLDSAQQTRAASLLAAAADSAAAVRASMDAAATPTELAQLNAIWAELWRRMDAALGPVTSARIASVRAAWR